MSVSNNPKGNPEILIQAAQAKKQDAANRLEEAIQTVIESGEAITFRAIAEAAGLSVSYLYKYPEIKNRISQLRNQYKSVNGGLVNNEPQIQPATDKSKAVLMSKLRQENRRLRNENEELKRHIEVAQGRVIELSHFEKENQRLKQKIADLEQALQNTKIVPINNNQSTSVKNNIINDEIQDQLIELGIKLNPTLKKLIQSKSEQEVKNALAVVKEMLNNDTHVRSVAGLFRKALEEDWIPNLTDQERELSKIKQDFKEWYDLASAQGLVQASKKENSTIQVLEITGKWTPIEEMFERGWTLEYLQQISRQ